MSTPESEKHVPFVRFLHTVADGDCNREMTEQLHELGQALSHAAQAASGKVKAELILKLKFTTDGSGIVDVNYEIDAKEPKPLRARSAMWLTRDGNFTGQAPRQEALDLHGVPDDEEEATS